jgi:hypothetical protein
LSKFRSTRKKAESPALEKRQGWGTQKLNQRLGHALGHWARETISPNHLLQDCPALPIIAMSSVGFSLRGLVQFGQKIGRPPVVIYVTETTSGLDYLLHKGEGK